MLCKSIKMQVLLSIAFGIAELFPLLATGTPANDTCVNAISDIACYLKGSEELVGWNTAKQACTSSHSTLPVIRNKNDQDDLAGYLKSQTKTISAWTAGKIFNYTGWTWVNKEKLNENVQVYAVEGLHLSDDEPSPSGLEEAHVALYYTGTDLKFIELHASQELPYICQGIDARCIPSSKVNMHSECISMFNDNRTWYDARNQCLMTDLDLAVIHDDVHGYMYLKDRLKLNQGYWIGLRKKSWRWTVNEGGSDDEVKYTNWDNHVYSTDGECIFVDGSDGNWKWKTRGCTQQIAAAVCQRVALDESTTGGPQAATEQIVLFAAVGAGIVIIICVIVLIFVALSTRNRETRQSKLNDNSLRNNREDIDNKFSNAAVYASGSKRVNAPVNISDDIGGVYAEVKMSTLNHSEGETTNQQPGILYASLDFKEGSSNQEPDQKPDLATALTKVGPFGDIYALPDAKRHEATSSPLNESDSQPVKFASEGEVFYANLQPETLEKEKTSADHNQPS